ncbi:Zn-dependent exopeptidase [Pleurotus eryngii]|uniref:Peptide hydrolase n=1 Tax=Pleurotus eryngii TaxID=5323 RepID=A0A9P6D1R9_PLEER|nr:Zn-dependent exopeptidase [Pleurotus eryngii]
MGDAALAAYTPRTDDVLAWVYQAPASEELLSSHPPFPRALDTFIYQILPKGSYDDSSQLPLDSSSDRALLYRSDTSALVCVNRETARQLDTLIPPMWKSALLPSSPIASYPVPTDAVKRIKHITSSLKFSPDIAATVNSISIPQMRNDIRFLTGEDGKSGIVSRHSFADGSRVAAAWLKNRFEETGAHCILKAFSQGFAPNVICRYEAEAKTNATVILGAHYDSRGSFGNTRAPGGDDDGSGTISLLSIARTIASRNVKFHTNVELVAFAGEEQGLVGSRAYAHGLRAAGANVTMMIQADMLAYRAPNEPLQLGLPESIGTPAVVQLVANVSALYSPELTVGFTKACCSDHQSFHEQGFASTQVFERAGWIADPMYHNSGDVSDREGYDFEQVKAIAKVQFATVLHVAGFTISG